MPLVKVVKERFEHEFTPSNPALDVLRVGVDTEVSSLGVSARLS